MTALPFKDSMSFAYGEPAELAPGVIRLVANNPGPFTFKGTNTYLVLGKETAAVIDPGPKDERHVEAILAASAGRRITHILITHAHRDHVDGAPALRAATGAPILAYPRHRPAKRIDVRARQFVDHAFRPDTSLADGQRVSGDGWALVAVHTPGHAPDHLCLALEEQGILFSGDHVMAWNTTVIAPPEGVMADYLASLDLLLARDDVLYLPGHGGRLAEPRRMVRAQLLHRRWREQSVLDAIREGARSIEAIVPLVYQGLEPRLLSAAALSVEAHVEHLIGRGLVTSSGDPASVSFV